MWNRAAVDRVVGAYAKALPGASHVPHSLPRAPPSPTFSTPAPLEDDESRHLLSQMMLPPESAHLLHEDHGLPS